MDRIGTRTWAIIGVIGLTLFASYWVRFSLNRSLWAPKSAGFSYEMPRPQNFEPGFDLSTRSFERQVKPKKTNPTAPVKTADAVKKADPKAAAAAKAAAAKNAAAETAAAAARKKKTSVNVTDTSRQSGMSGFEQAQDQTQNPNPQAMGAYRLNESPKAAEPTKKAEEETALTPAQWRSLLQSAPNAENIAKFIQAKQSGQLDQVSYFQIVHELLIDAAEDRRNAGLAILDQDPSASAFEFMVSELAQAPGEVQSALQTRIESFSAGTKVLQLVSVLSSSQNPTVLMTALERVHVALSTFQQSAAQGGQSNGGLRPPGSQSTVSGLTVQHFQSFIPTLQRLIQSHVDGSVTSQASQLLSAIQNL